MQSNIMRHSKMHENVPVAKQKSISRRGLKEEKRLDYQLGTSKYLIKIPTTTTKIPVDPGENVDNMHEDIRDFSNELEAGKKEYILYDQLYVKSKTGKIKSLSESRTELALGRGQEGNQLHKKQGHFGGMEIFFIKMWQ